MSDSSPRTTDFPAPSEGLVAPLQIVGGRPVSARRIMPWEAISVPSLVNLVFAAILGLVAAAGAGAIVLRQTPVYQSAAVLLIDQASVISSQQNDGVLVKLSFLRNKYVALGNSSRVLVPASAATGIPVDELARAQIAAPVNSLLLFSLSRGADPAETEKLANALAEQLSLFVAKEQNDAGVARQNQITVAVIQQARSGVKIRPTESHARSVATVLGGGGVLAAYIVLQLATARRRLTPA